MANPGTPASATVGISGAPFARCASSMASSLSLPVRACTSTFDKVRMPIGTWPPSRSLIACPPPLYPMCCRSMPAILLRCNPPKCCAVPTPEVPNDSLPGFFFAYSINSFSEFTGNDGCTAITWGSVPMMAMGVKSLMLSKGRFLMSNGNIVCGGLTASSSVYPSGDALATTSEPIAASPPARLSITTGCPSASLIRFPVARATVSAAPPAANGTMRRTGLLG